MLHFINSDKGKALYWFLLFYSISLFIVQLTKLNRQITVLNSDLQTQQEENTQLRLNIFHEQLSYSSLKTFYDKKIENDCVCIKTEDMHLSKVVTESNRICKYYSK